MELENKGPRQQGDIGNFNRNEDVKTARFGTVPKILKWIVMDVLMKK